MGIDFFGTKRIRELERINAALREEIRQMERERKTVSQLLEETHIMQIFKILHESKSPLVTKEELQKLWDILPYYPPDWNFRKHLVRKRDGNRCQKCGKKLPADYIDEDNYLKKDYGQVHHIKPLSMKGTNEFTNLMLLCTPCHRAAHGKIYNYIYSRIYNDADFAKSAFLWEEYGNFIRRTKPYRKRFDDDEADPYGYEDPGTDDYYNIPLWEDWSDYE